MRRDAEIGFEQARGFVRSHSQAQLAFFVDFMPALLGLWSQSG